MIGNLFELNNQSKTINQEKLNLITLELITRASADSYYTTENENGTEYIYGTQLRNLAMSALLETRTVLLARTLTERNKFLKLIEDANVRIGQLNQASGLNLPQVQKPFFIHFDTKAAKGKQVNVKRSILLNDELANKVGKNKLGVRTGLMVELKSLNFLQMVGLQAEVMKAFKDEYPENINFDLSALEKKTSLIDSLYPKTAYQEMLGNNPIENELPPHLPTATISEDEFKAISSFEEFQTYFINQTGKTDGITEFFAKSSADTGGEVAYKITRENFAEDHANLVKQIDDKNRTFKIDLMIQPLITPPAAEERDGLPVGVGITAYREANGEIRILSVMGQINTEATTNYLGSYYDKELEQRILKMAGEEKIKNIFGMLPKDYIGPAGTDLMLNANRQYVAVSDLNPRMPASFIALTWKDYLEKQGIKVDQIANLGYRGRAVFEDYGELMEFVKRKGWMVSKNNPKGVIPQPSCVRPDGVDLIFVNCNFEEVQGMTKELESEMVEKTFTINQETQKIALYL